jgi:hypothetical protein
MWTCIHCGFENEDFCEVCVQCSRDSLIISRNKTTSNMDTISHMPKKTGIFEKPDDYRNEKLKSSYESNQKTSRKGSYYFTKSSYSGLSWASRYAKSFGVFLGILTGLSIIVSILAGISFSIVLGLLGSGIIVVTIFFAISDFLHIYISLENNTKKTNELLTIMIRNQSKENRQNI